MPYTVKANDTLGEIALALGVADWRDLYINGTRAGDTDPKRLQIGATIYTPEEGPNGEGAAPVDTPAETTPADQPADNALPAGGTTDDPNAIAYQQAVNAADDRTGGGYGELAQSLPEQEQLAGTVQQQQGVGGAGPDPETTLSIMGGANMVWGFDRTTGKWYVQYKLPNSGTWAVFEAAPDQMDMLFGDGLRPWSYEALNGGLAGLLARPGRVFSGNIAEMEGDGTLEDHVARVTALALDNGVLPTWAKDDPAAMDILYLSVMENKSLDWVYAQLAKLPSFKQRFPGIQTLMSREGLDVADAVSAFLEFESGVKRLLDANGFNGSAFHQTQVPVLLEKGYTLEMLGDAIGSFRRMKLFQPALSAFNQILVSQGFDPIGDQQTFFDFVRGTAPAQYYNLWEASSIQEAAANAGISDLMAPTYAVRAALAGDFTLESASKAMQTAASLLLRLRHEVDVSKFDLDHEELIDISLGLRPRSGRAESEINESIQRAVETARGFLQERAKPFIGFTSTGTPQAASLSNLRQPS